MSAPFTHSGPGTPAASWRARPEWARISTVEVDGTGRPHRLVVAAAHPDDESLGAGGLVTRLHEAGVPSTLVLATAGERSHPHSPSLTPEALARRRTEEAHEAWRRLGGRSDDLVLLGRPDGDLSAYEDELTRRLVEIVGDGRHTLLVTPWRRDGHPDHDALGRAGRRAAFRTGARLWQYPVWFWHRADPDEAPWTDLVRVPLGPGQRRRKAEAIAAHASQTQPLSEQPGDETLLSASLLEHFAGPVETYVVEEPADDALDALHAEDVDPWGTTTRWYEERKRGLLLAVLPARCYARTLDVGCSTGTLTAALAGRSDTVVAVDRSPHAVRLAREALADLDGVDVRQLDAPHDWPEGRFDLVVVSESGYFLSPAALDQLVVRVRESLAPGGTVVLGHWRHPISGWPLSGPDVHARFLAGGLELAARYRDRDVEILVLGGPGVLPSPYA